MALIVEDGTIVANANSYVTREEIIAYGQLRGVVIADDDTTDVKAIKATDYLELFRDRYIGREVEPLVQSLAWPRDGASYGFVTVGSTIIPVALKKAQMQLTLEVNAGVDLFPTVPANRQVLLRQKLGPIEREFSEAAAMASTILPTMPLVASFLAPLLRAGGPTRSYRV